MILGEQNLKDEFSKLVRAFWNRLSNMIKLKDANDSIPSSKNSLMVHGSRAKERRRLSKGLGNHAYDAFKYFCQNSEYNKIGWLFLMLLVKVGEEKDELRD